MATTMDFIEVKGVKVPLIFEADTRLPIASMQLVFRNGGSINDGEHNGLANISAKMMNEGSKRRGSNGFANALDSKAIHLSANVGRETFVFEIGSLSEHFSEGLGLMRELLEEPNLTKDTLKKVQTVSIGALSRKENDYDYVANNELKAILFENTPLQYPAAGTVESLKTLTLKDVEKYLDEHLTLSRAIVVLGGKLDLEAIKKEIAATLEVLEIGKPTEVEYYEVVKKPKTQELQRTTEQAYLYFGSPYHMRVGNDDYYKARVATFILGSSGFGSRLMEEIRVKRGLAYSAYARINVSLSHSYFMGYLQTKLESREEAQATVKEVIATFLKEGVTQDELDQAKKFLLGSEPLRVETLSQRLSRTFQEYYRGLELGHSQAELEKIRTLSLDELNAFISSHDEITELSFAIVRE